MKSSAMYAQDRTLARLESDSIHIIREIAAEARRPVLLYSMGKDSTVLLHLVRKAFRPLPPPLPLLHVDTGWKFRQMYAARDQLAAEAGVELIVHQNPEGIRRGINPDQHGGELHTRIWKTDGLKQALDQHGFDSALAGARRDEEASRAKERIVSVRGAGHRWDPRRQRPEMWHLFNVRVADGQTLRVFPLSDWTELDIWHYIRREGLAVSPLYFSAPRPVVQRQGGSIMVDDDRLMLMPGEVPDVRDVRFRTLGCYPLTCATESPARSLDDIIAEVASATESERRGRLIDASGEASMEAKKREGYF
jgi:sulfate adenylyltransferase subunit 2